jgi:hypothetical protein
MVAASIDVHFLSDFRRTIRWFEPINCVRVMVESLPGTLPWILQRSYIAQVALEVRSYLLHLSLVLYRGNWGWAR